MPLSKMQLEIQQAVKEYEKRFGEKYGIVVGQQKSDKEILDELNYCLKNNIPQPDPDYSDNVYY